MHRIGRILADVGAMMSEYEARQALQALLEQFQSKQPTRRALLGDSNGTVMVANRPGWAYIRYQDDLNRLSIVRYLLQEQLPDETPVKVGKKYPDDPFEQVLGVDWELYAWSPAQSTVTQWATPAISIEDLAPGKVLPTSPLSLSVDVRAFLYVNGDAAVEFGGAPIDLTASVPGVAGHRLALVYLDLDIDALSSANGTIVAAGATASAPTVPENGLPLAVVDLSNGDTEITGDDIYQYKAFYNVVGVEIPLAQLGGYARGYIIRGGAADWEAYDASGNGYALVGDGTDILSDQTPTWTGGHTWTAGPQLMQTGAAGTIGLIVRGAAAQATDLVQIQDSGSNVLGGVDERGIPFSDGNATGNNNLIVGPDAGNPAAMSGAENTLFGYEAGAALTLGAYNTLLGSNAGTVLTQGFFNTAVGRQALQACVTGQLNAALGANALNATTTSSCVGIGAYAAETNVSGLNLAVGSGALRYNQTGDRNIAIGHVALQGVVASSNVNYNIAIGHTALDAALTGADCNIAIGLNAGTNITTGSNNVLLGDEAGVVLTTQDGNVFIGYEVGKTNLAGAGQLAIHNADTSTPLIYGVFATPALRLGANTTIGWGAVGVDYTLTFDGETNDGVMTWMEDEDYLQFSDDVLFPDNEAVKFGTNVDMDIYYDGSDGHIRTDLVAASDLLVDCGANKTIELQTTVWKDINLGAAMLSLPVATQPDEVQIVDEAGSGTGIYTWGFAVNELVSGVFEMQHDYQEGSDITFHVHWGGNAAPTGVDNVRWELTYTIVRDDNTINAPTTLEVETAYDTQYEWLRSNFAAIDGSTGGVDGGDIKIGDQFFFKLKRIAAVGDAYAADALVATVGLHYQVDTMGSRQIGTK